MREDHVIPALCPFCALIGVATLPKEEKSISPEGYEMVAEVCPTCGSRSFWEHSHRKAVRKWNALAERKPGKLLELALKFAREESNGIEPPRVQVR